MMNLDIGKLIANALKEKLLTSLHNCLTLDILHLLQVMLEAQ